MPELTLSIIIPTRNRQDLLSKLLDSLTVMQVQAGQMEVIVVDDASQDGTAKMLAQRQNPFVLSVLRQETPEGPAAARNRGAKAAKGVILGFLDSDVTAHPQWWQAVAPHFQDPHVGAVEGATLPPPGSGRPTPFTNYVCNDRGNSFQTSNLLCRRELFLRLGGFDGRFCRRLVSGRISHNREDSDLAFAILESGARITFEPGAVVYHPLFAPDFQLHIRKAAYGWQEALLRRKHPLLYKKYLKWIDGRAFPVFYWGMFLGAPLLKTGLLADWVWLAGSGAAA